MTTGRPTDLMVLRRSWPGVLLMCGGIVAALYAAAVTVIDGPKSWLVAALAAAAAIALWDAAVRRHVPRMSGVVVSALVVAALVRSAHPSATPWQVPSTWSELTLLTPLGASLVVAAYLAASFVCFLAFRRALRIGGSVALLAAPYLFNILLLLASSGLVRAVGVLLLPASLVSAVPVAQIGRALILFVFNEAVLLGVGLLMDRRWLRAPVTHLMVLGGSAFAAFSPLIADWGSSAAVAGLHPLLRSLPVAAFAGVAEAALWAQTFLITGALLDALHGRRPTPTSCVSQWKSGFIRGGLYGGLFMLFVQLGALIASVDALMSFLREHLPIGGALCGMLLFPLARTLVESFDGSEPFFTRLLRAYREPANYLRGAVAGTGLGFALQQALPTQSDGWRFLAGCAIGGFAYGGSDCFIDLLSIARGRRQRLQTWRVYLMGAVAGGLVGGALAWYFDAAQLQVVLDKFARYATVNFTVSGGQSNDFTVYPLFSKWGAIHLGQVGGGVNLLYSESLAGVINWAIAAPLFSINLVVLTALFERSVAPIRELFSGAGLVSLVEQTVRVLRWGPWMAPIISSFLRMAPQPSWYNQDGLVRTVVAIWQSGTLPPDAFRAWSLECFLGLLAYDWLRVLIWFDHMGLRVATLVNLSFVGADKLDEKAARFVGHSARTRVIPEGIRRFLTWAPLLIPFYIPRGGDWDHAWNGAEALARNPQTPLLPQVSTLLVGYAVAAILAAVVAAAIFGLRRLRGLRVAPRSAPSFRFRLANGQYTLEMNADGLGYAHVDSALRPGFEIDLTRRPDDPLQRRGKFFWLREVEDGRAIGLPWSLTAAPTGRNVASPLFKRVDPTCLRLEHSRAGLRVEVRVTVLQDDPVERWRLCLTNLRERPRCVELTSYRELAMAATDSYRRTPAFAGMHVATSFVSSLGAIMTRNRLLHDGNGNISPEVGFHAVGHQSRQGVKLVGYEDSRSRFIGHGNLASPALFAGVEPRRPDDEGGLHSFDPVASLQLHVELRAHETLEIDFIDGYARSALDAARLISRHLGQPLPQPSELDAALAKCRALADASAALDIEAFTDDGREVTADPVAVRPWTHVLANDVGQGAVVSADGEVFSFNRNAQQNALSPFNLEGISTQMLGQAVYVVDPETGEVDCAAFAALRRRDSRYAAAFGPGYARFTMRRTTLELEETVFVPSDAPLQLRCLHIRNPSTMPRRLRVVPYVEIVLAETPVDSRGRIEARVDEVTGALLFRNPANDFRKGWAFVATSLSNPRHETRRARFLGAAHDGAQAFFVRNGCGDFGCRDDGRRCAAFSGEVDVPANGEVTVVVVLGQADDIDEATGLVSHYRETTAAVKAFASTKAWWEQQLATLQVTTNHPDFDRLVNIWLPYQLLTARLWARTGAQQRSGAFGFRDQLQDVLPLCFTQPQRARAQILLHATQQFREGDAVKWWHPSWEGRIGIAVRTAASDPQLWLPYVLTRYLQATGDDSLLHETVPFLEGNPLPPGREGTMFVPRESRDAGTLYEHCRRAIEWSLARIGEHGLPLLGSGDWNDGLDAPGLQGRAESVWMGFFLHTVLRDFAPVAGRIAGPEAQRRYEDAAARLRTALEPMWREHGYIRATTDSGGELHFASALMTSWPALSGAVDLDRAVAALDAGLCRLEKDDRVLLLSPPFDEHSKPYPGRIAEYPPGVRENGGQYSHGASWIVDAWLRCGEMARQQGHAERAVHYHRRAWEIWQKISPLTKTSPAYGLPPHQQPADVYDGNGHGGRGGWSWYTGAAARMLSAAYGLLGVSVENGELRMAGDAFSRDGDLQLRRVVFRGRRIDGSEPAARAAMR